MTGHELHTATFILVMIMPTECCSKPHAWQDKLLGQHNFNSIPSVHELHGIEPGVPHMHTREVKNNAA